MPKFITRMTSYVLFLIFLPQPLMAETNASMQALETQITLLKQQQYLSIAGDTITPAAGLLPKFYQQIQYALAWTDPKLTEVLLDNIETISEDGLDREDYHYSALASLRQKIAGNQNTELNRAKLDIMMTNALLRLVYHLKYGKVVPHQLDSNWNFNRDFFGANPLTTLNSLLASEAALSSYLTEHRELGQYHRFLKQALVRYRQIKQAGGWQAISDGPLLKPNTSDERVPLIYQRLLITGDIDTPKPEGIAYTPELVQAVKNFQQRHALESDGIVGSGTLNAMNIPVQARIDQIRANLERTRWVAQDIKDKFVLVNIAGFQAYLVDDRKVLWKSKVQVGKKYRQTPVFKDEIEYLDMNPTWTVPPTIFRKDVFPKIKKDIGYLKKKNMNIIDNQGKVIDIKAIDWNKATARNFRYMIRQEPGPQNALGRIKFMFPNKHSVYLHDTPSKKKFERTERAFSSGCIRLQRPFELAELLLNDPSKWNSETFNKILASGKLNRIRLPQPVPILVLYATVDINLEENGVINFNHDIYGRDDKIIEALKQKFNFVAPENLPEQS